MGSSNAKKLGDMDEMLHRQVHPSFIQNGRPASRAFKPNSSDDGQVSVSRGTIVSAEAAYERYRARGRASIGAWSVTVFECNQVSVACYADPLDDDDAHARLDMKDKPASQLKTIGDKLADFARVRGRQYPPQNG